MIGRIEKLWMNKKKTYKNTNKKNMKFGDIFNLQFERNSKCGAQ